MDSINDKINQVRETYLSHGRDFPVLEQIHSDIIRMHNEMRANRKIFLRKGILEPVAIYLINAICEFDTQIINSLKNRHYSSAEAMSRISIEHSVNLQYILNTKTNDRVISLMKHYILGAKTKATKWKNDALRLDLKEAIPHAEGKISLFNNYIDSNPHIVSDKVAEWPDAKSRFRDIGQEYHYHIVYASASDSVHTLSEDIFNLITLNSYPKEIQEKVFENIYYQRMSFAHYLSIYSLLYCCGSFVSFLEYLKNTDFHSRIEKFVKVLNQILEKHEKDDVQIKEPI
ncbi:DUF5677 domain-containing protein [Leptospira barantonii]|uniref:Uncharacterized protein n=1 Tax=Leptospira barantonii TaxID=2023184 RepID=A0ABX4NKX2_9LEPT|nr:DUF5677 domain-containing protein [Leptospira barantonii]PJZ57455.1 hypothetical protein CH367_08855 [Leptospira barantonii]